MKLLCTIGPASYDASIIRKLDALGADLFRINLSHTNLDEIADRISFLRKHSRVPISLDTEGAQIRTGKMTGGAITLKEHHEVIVTSEKIIGTEKRFSFYPTSAISFLNTGDIISIDFNAALVQVVGLSDGEVRARVITGGMVGSNKAVSIPRALTLPPLTEKDKQAIEIGQAHNINHYALSFANRPEDVVYMRRLVGKSAIIIAKIESLLGLMSCADIAERADAILIDRGDLSREIPIEQLPLTQKRIIRIAKSVNRPVYVATNFLESMVTSSVPTRAEINDIYNTLLDGADGLVLAAETAVGAHPVRCAAMVKRLSNQYLRDSYEPGIPKPGGFDEISPHGGTLVSAVAEEHWTNLAEQERLPSLTVDAKAMIDIEQICHGIYSPLDGFMSQTTLKSVLSKNRLPDGTVWTLPIVLPVAPNEAKRLSPGIIVGIKGADRTIHSILEVTDIYEASLEKLSTTWFGTSDKNHPGLSSLIARGTHFIAGKVYLVPKPSAEMQPYNLGARFLRSVFSQKGWNRVVGFHSRNVAHQIHLHIQLKALEDVDADGLLISPVLGPKKPGDFLFGPIVKTYEALMRANFYPTGRTFLGGFASYSHYAGPREAVFTALCRKNMGCSHFIVGRDHTGVGNFYEKFASQKLFEMLPDLGIVPVFFDEIVYDRGTKQYTTVPDANDPVYMSGELARSTILKGGRLPDWFMHPVVQDELAAHLARGEKLFHSSEP